MRLGSFLLLSTGAHFILAFLFLFGGSRNPFSYPFRGSGGGVFVEMLSPGPPQERTKLPSGSGTASSREAGTGSGEETGSDPVLAEIRSRIERVKQYPHLAQKTGLEGVVSIRFQIDQEGRPTPPEILESSGSPLLDQSAIVSIRKAAPFPNYDKPVSLSLRYTKGAS